MDTTMTTTTTTSTRPAEGGPGAAGGDPSRATVCVEVDPRGRVAVRTRTSGVPGRPRLRPVLLSSSATAARVCLVPEGALLLAGDDIEVQVDVGAGASLELVEPAGTVAYDMRGGRARWDVDVRLDVGASLVWGGEPFVVAFGADVRRTTQVELAADARLLLRETLVLGRHGEDPGRLAQRLWVTGPGGRPVLVEELALDGRSAPGILGDHRVLSSVLALGLDLPADAPAAGRYDLDAGGAWWRGLGRELHLAVPHEAWQTTLRASRG
jgi:urease accessory protein